MNYVKSIFDKINTRTQLTGDEFKIVDLILNAHREFGFFYEGDRRIVLTDSQIKVFESVRT